MPRKYHCLGSRPDGIICCKCSWSHGLPADIQVCSSTLSYLCLILMGLCLDRHLRSDHIVMTSRELQSGNWTFTPFLNLNTQKKKTAKEMKACLELTRYSLRQRDNIKSSQYLKPCAEMSEVCFPGWHFDYILTIPLARCKISTAFQSQTHLQCLYSRLTLDCPAPENTGFPCSQIPWNSPALSMMK